MHEILRYGSGTQALKRRNSQSVFMHFLKMLTYFYYFAMEHKTKTHLCSSSLNQFRNFHRKVDSEPLCMSFSLEKLGIPSRKFFTSSWRIRKLLFWFRKYRIPDKSIIIKINPETESPIIRFLPIFDAIGFSMISIIGAGGLAWKSRRILQSTVTMPT